MVNIPVVALSPITGKTVAARLQGKCRLAPLIRAATGFPVSVTTGRDNSLTAIGRDRPNQVLADPYPASQSPAQWINPAAFVPNPTGTFGGLGRNTLRAPGSLRVDVALSREFALLEPVRL